MLTTRLLSLEELAGEREYFSLSVLWDALKEWWHTERRNLSSIFNLPCTDYSRVVLVFSQGEKSLLEEHNLPHYAHGEGDTLNYLVTVADVAAAYGNEPLGNYAFLDNHKLYEAHYSSKLGDAPEIERLKTALAGAVLHPLLNDLLLYCTYGSQEKTLRVRRDEVIVG